MRDARIQNIEVTKMRDARIQNIVVPAKAGTQWRAKTLDSRFRGNDES
jgi:hypothetical protein